MKRIVLIAVAALLVPSAALAAKPQHPQHPAKGPKSAPKVTHVLAGTLSGYTAYDSSTSTNGSITIVVKKANHHAASLKGQTLTFPVGPNTKISLQDGTTTITDGDRGLVKVRAAKNIPAADLASTLQSSTAGQVVDQGATS